ncbi:DsbA family protein [Candidatus Woesebacteria bacterium]|nr:DsbA family protein [Candidatus Woesebacteria bacterium]
MASFIEEQATVLSVVSQIVSAVALAVIALVAMMLWRGGGLSFGSAGSGTGTPSAAAPAAAPEEVTQLTDAQWAEVIKDAPAAKGNNNAKVTMVEFTDYQCPFCARYFTDTYGQIMKNFVDNGKIKYVTRDYPLPFHANANIASQAARCAGDQRKYWEMHDKLFSNQAAWSEGDPKTKFEQYAKEIGINSGNFMKCVNDGKYKQAVDADMALGTKVGVSATPSFAVNGKMIVGAYPYAEFEKAINEALGN